MRLWSCVLVAFSVFAAPALAQVSADRRIAGTVIDAVTRAPIEGASVEAGSQRAATGPDGRFSLRIGTLRTTIVAAAAGFFPQPADIDAGDRDVLDIQLALVRNTFSDSLQVVGAPATAAPASVPVTPAQVLRTPGALDNVFRTLQTLPGVSAVQEFDSRVAVQGGSPDQNLTVMDGVEIHDPYRLFGLTSAFNPETIQRFDLATGGFSAKYGDRLSSLLLIDNRPGDGRRRLGGSASLSITDANVVFEGGLPAGARGSWLVTGRRTYYDLVAERLADQEFPKFADLQAKVVWDLTPSRTLSFFGLRSREKASLDIDESDAEGLFQDDTRNDLAWTRLDWSLSSALQAHSTVSYSRSASRVAVDAVFENTSERSNSPEPYAVGRADVAFDRRLAIKDVALRQEFVAVRGAHVIEAGGELHRLRTEQSFFIDGDRNPTAANGSSVQGGVGLPDRLVSSSNLTRGGAWVLDRWQVSARASVEAGLRVDRSGFPGDVQVSPRLSTLVSIAPATRLRAAAGLYTQGPGNEKQVQSDYVLNLSDASEGPIQSERALVTSAGFEHDLSSDVSLRAEVYYKRFSDLLIGRLESEGERLARVARYDFPASLADAVPVDPFITTVPVNDGRGTAYGFDLFLSRTTAPVDARLRGWASYTWGRASRTAYGRTYPFEYDRRHAFSAVAGYRLSQKWELATTVRVASGFPRTPPVGLRVAGRETNRETIVPKVDPGGLLVYAVDLGGVSNLNSGRLPVFARLDVRATWRPRGAAGRWELYVEVINALNRKNAGTVDPRLEYNPASDRPRLVERRDQFVPRLPTIGIRVKW